MLEQALKALSMNILEFFSTIICGGVVAVAILAVIWIIAKGWNK